MTSSIKDYKTTTEGRQRLGKADLALHYANIVMRIHTFVSVILSFIPDASDFSSKYVLLKLQCKINVVRHLTQQPFLLKKGRCYTIHCQPVLKQHFHLVCRVLTPGIR